MIQILLGGNLTKGHMPEEYSLLVNSFFDDFIGQSKGKDQKDAIGNHIKDARIIFQRCKGTNPKKLL